MPMVPKNQIFRLWVRILFSLLGFLLPKLYAMTGPTQVAKPKNPAVRMILSSPMIAFAATPSAPASLSRVRFVTRDVCRWKRC